jgi:phosphoribosyl 1,2-cyclic phosphate phosphodiesterase
MKVTRRFTLLGCSSSPGVPRINGDWGNCDPNNPRNRRTRASFLIEQIGPDGGKTTVVVDTGPDFREQMIRAKVEHIDAVVYSHAHADHLHGIDDLRGYFITQKNRIPIYAEPVTMARIEDGFGYCLKTPAGSSYPPIVQPMIVDSLDQPIEISGAGGTLSLLPLKQQHGDIISIGLRIGDVAYCCDISDFPEETVGKLSGLDLLYIDALQYRPHPSHLSLDQALSWIERLAPRHAVLTHMHTPLDYETVMGETPSHVEPGYDGYVIEKQMDI